MATSALGMPLLLMLAPAYTAALTSRVADPGLAGLDDEHTQQLAEQVRAFVAGRDGAQLPESLADGRAAFDEKAISHLDDVRALLRRVRLLTYGTVGVTAAWLLAAVLTQRLHDLSVSLVAAGLLTVAVVAFAALCSVVDFGWFFAAFHGVFFEQGTWQFPSDSLLIALFPEQFWIASAATWGAASSLIAVLLALSGRSIAHRASQERE